MAFPTDTTAANPSSIASAPSATALTVQGLTKRYGSRTAVDGLDLELPRGVVAGFVGPNGSGKTTTMSMLLGLVRPSAGSGTVLGEPISDPGAYLHRVGALIETPAFYPALTGRENLRVFAIAGRHDEARIDELLDTVGLTGRGDDRTRTYSLGMKQRLGIAAALLGDPELLILDEPTNGLDPQGVREMRALVGELAGGGRTVLVSSHDLSELEQICDWLLLIDAGTVLFQGPTRDLLDAGHADLAVAPQHAGDIPALADALRTAGFTVETRSANCVSSDRSAAPSDAVSLGDDESLVVMGGSGDAVALAAAVNRCAFAAGITLVELHPVRNSLEDRFLAMTAGGAS
jgi:ABC-2 type transport system ATP-binding protein